MLELPTQLTLREARPMLAALSQRLRAEPSGAAVVVDARALQHIDSAALALLLDLQRQARAQGRPLRIEGAPARLLELARLYGVEALLALAD